MIYLVKITLRAINTEQEAIHENHLFPLTNTCLSKVSVNQYDDSTYILEITSPTIKREINATAPQVYNSVSTSLPGSPDGTPGLSLL